LAGARSFLHINGLHTPSSEPMNAGKEEKTLLKINSLADRVSDLSETSPFLTKAVFEDISLHRDAYLEIHFPGLKPIKVELDEQQTVLGRGPGCRIQLQLSNVSRLHARVSRLDEEYLLEDLESTNGTFVNGVRIHKCVLRNNDQIQMGDTKILYVEEKTRQLHDPT
jgi:hypothetical protein